MEAHVHFCRSAAMPRASAFRAPTARLFRSSAASQHRNERRCKPPRKPEILTGISSPPNLIDPDPHIRGYGQASAAFGPSAVSSILHYRPWQRFRIKEHDANLTLANEETTTARRFRRAPPHFQAVPDLLPSITPTREPRRMPISRPSSRKRRNSTMLHLPAIWTSS